MNRFNTIKYIITNRYLKNFFLIKERLGLVKTFILSYKVLKTILLKLPRDISVETASFCNLKCPMCIQSDSMKNIHRQSKVLKLDDFKKFVDDIKGFAYSISLYYAGEPLLNKNLFDMIAYANDSGLLTYINTNGVLLKNPEIRKKLLQSGLFKVHISFDGATQETYESYRVGADFYSVKDSIKKFIAERGEAALPIIGLQTIATTKTIPEFNDYIEMAKGMGADYAFSASKYVDQYKHDPYPEDLEDLLIGGEYSRYERLEKGRLIKKPCDSKQCPYLYNIYILTDGTIVHCCYDYDGEYTFGNAFQKNLKELWFDKKYLTWRKNEAGPMHLPLCHRSCTASHSVGWRFLYKKQAIKINRMKT